MMSELPHLTAKEEALLSRESRRAITRMSPTVAYPEVLALLRSLSEARAALKKIENMCGFSSSTDAREALRIIDAALKEPT